MAETAKKVTQPRKPRATASGATSVAPKKKITKAKVVAMKPSSEEIAMLAHRFWVEGVSKHGRDAEDWFRAEAKLLGKAS